jgi:Salmonella virulence plasmid 65kDa B protein
MTVPFALSPARSGFGPQLTLSYDLGSGKGPFGFGWFLGLPVITRKTDKGLPQYQDAEESDFFHVPKISFRCLLSSTANGSVSHRSAPSMESTTKSMPFVESSSSLRALRALAKSPNRRYALALDLPGTTSTPSAALAPGAG